MFYTQDDADSVGVSDLRESAVDQCFREFMVL